MTVRRGSLVSTSSLLIVSRPSSLRLLLSRWVSTAAFRAYCEVIDSHRHAAVLTHRESKSRSDEGLETIKRLEVETSEPLRTVIREGIDAGVLTPVDVDRGKDAGVDPLTDDCPQGLARLHLEPLDRLQTLVAEALALAVGEHRRVPVGIDDLAVRAERGRQPGHRVRAGGLDRRRHLAAESVEDVH